LQKLSIWEKMANNYDEIKWEYKPNNTYKPSEHDLRLVNALGERKNESYSGHDVLCQDFFFKRHRINKNSINWRCKHPQCSSTLSISKAIANQHERVILFKPHTIVEESDNPKLIHVPLMRSRKII
jgi:hypothetical protein